MDRHSSESHLSTDSLMDQTVREYRPDQSDDFQLRISSDDSVSQTGCSSRSKHSDRSSSSGSSIRAKMVEEEAKRKALEAKLRNIAEEQELAEQRFRLRMEEMELAKREEYLKCRNELAQVEARQMVYSSAMKEHYRHEIPSTSNWNPLANEFVPGHPREQNRNRSSTVGKFVNSSSAQDVTASTDKHIERETIIEKDNPVIVDTNTVESQKIEDNLIDEIVRKSNGNTRYCQEQNDSLQQMLRVQERQMVCMERMINSQKESSLSLTLPKAEVSIYDGEPTEYLNFVKTFRNLIETKTKCYSTRLNYLIQYTSGEVQELVKSCLPMPPEQGYNEALSLMKKRFGNNYRIATSHADKVTEGPQIKTEDGKALLQFSTQLAACANTLKEIGYLSKVENPDSLRKIIDRLPYDLRKKWRTKADYITEMDEREVRLDDISEFVTKEARILSHPIFGSVVKSSSSNQHERLKHNNKLKGDKSNHHSKYNFGTQVNNDEENKQQKITETPQTQENKAKYVVKCPKCKSDHRLSDCSKFKELSVENRRKFVSENRICFNCLYPNHRAKFCRQNISCETCKSKHSTLLHIKNVNSAFVVSRRTVGLPIVPVIVKSRRSSNNVTAYVLQDWGSTGTFCTDGLLERMGIKGENTTLKLTTLGNVNTQVECQKTDLEIFDLAGENGVELTNVFSRPHLPVDNDDIPRQVDIAKWPYLNGIEIAEVDASVEIIIGMDNNKALEPKEIIAAKDGGPYAVKTILGWSINGPLIKGQNGDSWCRSSNFIKADDKLSTQFEKFCNLEFNDSEDQEFGMSREDRRAITVFEETTKLQDGHYEVSLPWKQIPPDLPNNAFVARNRLQLLKKRFLKDENLFQKYSKFIDGLLVNGYAEAVPPDEIDRNDGMVWCLPHHPVIHPKKPDKLRVVFDCAAKYQGMALNDNLLQGPDLINTLFGVLVRFRQERVAVMGDVEAMFHQVRVTPNQRDVFRFLWWKSNNLDTEPTEFRMKVHIFGAISSPSICNYALRRTVDDNKEDFSQKTIDSVKRNFYVDDHLKSMKSEEEAISHIQNIRSLLSRGGFRLTKWNSNSTKVLESVPQEDRAVAVKQLDFDNLPTERALGVLWDMENDSFTIKVDLKDKPVTRRGILSIMSSVFDPLGFTAPVILPAKMILQELCRIRLGWDDTVTDKYQSAWFNWMEELPKLSNLVIGRCIKPPTFGEVLNTELHHFSDASESGYGVASYVRLIDVNGKIHCCFITGKSRVAPLKVMTIPRLELSAATLSVRLNRMLIRELDVPINKSTYWTDSTSVLKYIHNVDKRFKTFVANRVSFILAGSNPEDWAFISGTENPGDDASRGMNAVSFLKNKRWISGPEFLWKPECEWVQQPKLRDNLLDEDSEVKKEKRSFAATIKEDDIILKLAERCSSWYRTKRITAWIIRYKNRLRKSVENRRNRIPTKKIVKEEEALKLTVEEMKEAEIEIIKHLQREYFLPEIKSLETEDKKKRVSKSSSIVKLDPILVEGVLRVGGRLRRSEESFETKHQIILPKKTHITDMIIRHYHEVSAHSGRAYILSAIRRRFWIIKGNSAVRNVLLKCITCKKRQAPLAKQMMSDLPKDRVAPDKPAFTSVGVDCFGPFMVKRGRSQLKRWGCIFTCLACRAIHIEVLQSMDTDSFLNGLRRFIARRGCPAEIRSDNGSNFVGGNTELRSAIKEWNQQSIHNFLLQQNVKWYFNPPGGSHFGGAWERCIRTIRQVLNTLLKDQLIDDETLTTLFCEVEGIINGRPITPISDDVKDLEALTPNHLLLLKSGPELPPGKFKKEDCYSRRKWRHVQYLADVFWRRWTREYLPLLQERQKWTEKQRNFRVGDIILVENHELPRCSWPLGRILEVYPNAQDGYVRVIKVKTKNSILKRPVDKCVFLESDSTV